MKVYVKGQPDVILGKSHFVAEGGEGKIFARGKTGYKIFHDPARAIPIGKMALYTVAGGVSPFHTMPVALDVGTERMDLISDANYLGVRQKRLRGEDYYKFLDHFVDAVWSRWPTSYSTRARRDCWSSWMGKGTILVRRLPRMRRPIWARRVRGRRMR